MTDFRARLLPAAKNAVLPVFHACKITAARAYRPALRHVCRIGVTGSCAKTTTVELIAAILATRGKTRKGTGITNPNHRVAGTLLTTRPRHRYCVQELGGFEPGALARSTALFLPDIGVVTTVRMDHCSAFKGLENTAAEKATLVTSLHDDGLAILHPDDKNVLAMQEVTRAKVITYGLSPEAIVRGECVTSSWPERMSMTVGYNGKRIPMRTQLVGQHWAAAALASLATGIAVGIPLEHGVRAIQAVPPIEGRMSPHVTPDGICFIQDTWKAPVYSIPLVLDFLETARAERKILVIGSLSDYRGRSDRVYRDLCRQALQIADKVVFVGRWAHYGLKGRAHPEDDRVLAFADLYQASSYLRTYLVPGDLVVLKGSNRNDHLERLVLDRNSGVACWRPNCRKRMHCQHCRLRNSAFIPT